MSAVAVTALASVLGAIITGLSAWAIAKIGRKTGRESSEWERIEGLWKRVDDLEKRDAEKGQQIAALMAQNTGQAGQITRLERWKDAALRYIATLLGMIHDLGGTPPDPPADYTEH